VLEKYWLGYEVNTSSRIFSASKSIAGFLTGMAQEQGKIDISKRCFLYRYRLVKSLAGTGRSDHGETFIDDDKWPKRRPYLWCSPWHKMDL